MPDLLVLNVDVAGENIMSQPLLTARGLAKVSGKYKEIELETPITSVQDFIDAFKGLFQEEK